MKVVTLVNPVWRALLVTPSILGMTLVLGTASSLAQNQQLTNPTLAAASSIRQGLVPPPSLSSSTDSSTDQQGRSTEASTLIIQTSASPLVPAATNLSVLESLSPAWSLTPLQPPTKSIALSNFAQANIDIGTNIQKINDTNANTAMLLAQSTDSRDLQPVAIASPNGDFSPTLLAQSADNPETPFPPDSAETPAVEAADTPSIETPEAQAPTSSPTKWHFLFAPYIYVPLSIYGDAGFRTFRGRDISRDFNFTPGQITTALANSLDFAFFGALEAWTPSYKLGIFANVNYLALSNESTVTRQVRRPPGFDNPLRPGLPLPTALNADVNNQTLSVDLAASYRFYDPAKVNPKGIATEFDLGPVLFDVIGGINITSVNSEIDLTTNFGGDVGFDGGRTVVSPLLGGRFRWNTSPKLALVVAGSVSGFGISGLSQYSFRTGIDWMFSGNTSLGLGYRFGFLNYNKGNRRDFSLEANQNGPYVSFGFRF